jgi:hypothetical protein
MIETTDAYDAYVRLLYRKDKASPFEIDNVGRRHITIRQVVKQLDEQIKQDIDMLIEYFEQGNTKLEVILK